MTGAARRAARTVVTILATGALGLVAAACETTGNTRPAGRGPLEAPSPALRPPRTSGPAPESPAELRARRIAVADEQLAAVKDMRFWPSEEDRARWTRDVANAESLREAALSPDASEEDVAAYEGAVTIAYGAMQTIRLGEAARVRRTR